jgi:tetratricopeptide (TPR) repeat protein
MKLNLQLTAAAGILGAVAILSSGCAKLKARDNLNKGVNAFRTGQYAEAADDFKTAIDLDPQFPVARLYLATAYMTQYIPGADTPDNKRNAESAIEQFQKVLQDDPKNVLATQSLGSLYFNMKDYAKAIEWNKKVIELDPKNKEAYYTLGVIAWTQFVPADRNAKIEQGLRPEEGPLKAAKPAKGKKGAAPESDLKADLKAKYWQTLTDGIEDEKKALQIDPEYENAMAYMNLLMRYRADLDDSKDQYDADIKEATSGSRSRSKPRRSKPSARPISRPPAASCSKNAP